MSPIRLTAGTMSTESAANEMPTASASIEVATASTRNSRRSMRLVSLQPQSSSPSCSASQSILPPMNASSTNATQWSTGAMTPMNWLPSAHPMSGMSAWKPPKKSASTAAARRLSLRIPSPRQIETANASIETPTATSSSSTIPMLSPLPPGEPGSVKQKTRGKGPLPPLPRVSLIKARQAKGQHVDAPHAPGVPLLPRGAASYHSRRVSSLKTTLPAPCTPPN